MLTSIVPIIAITLALMFTPLVRQIGLKTGWVDQPGKRKVHQQPIVRVGGVAICFATILTLVVGLLLHQTQGVPLTVTAPMGVIILGGLGFFAIGLADDLLNLSPFLRLLLQAAVASLVWAAGVRVESLPLVGPVTADWLSLPLTFLWLAGVANAINWIDGLDGLAGGVSAIAAVALSLVCWQQQSPVELIGLALAGAILGFLHYNINPARIFMGDGGSYFIGFTLAAVATTLLTPTASLTHTFIPFFILAVPLADMVRVILSRLWDGKSPFFADQRHLHHKLLQSGFSVQAASGLIWCLAAWFGNWAVIWANVPASLLMLPLTTLLLLVQGYPLWSPLLRWVVPALTGRPDGEVK